MEMLLVPPGKFVMGKSPGDSEAVELEMILAEKHPELKYSEGAAHEVTITKAFYLGRTEVTQEQWMKVMGENPSYFQEGSRENMITNYINEGLTKQEAQERAVKEIPGGWEQEKNPVEQVSWDDCQKFCAKTGMILPTEAQWEYACRAGVRKPRYGELDQIAWYTDNSDRSTHPVAKKAPNTLGFYDLIGNVWEWTNDWYAGDYYKSCADGVVDPTGPAQSELGGRVLRGGGGTAAPSAAVPRSATAAPRAAGSAMSVAVSRGLPINLFPLSLLTFFHFNFSNPWRPPRIGGCKAVWMYSPPPLKIFRIRKGLVP